MNRHRPSPEQALMLAEPDGPPPTLAGMLQLMFAASKALSKIEPAFRTEGEVGGGEHDEDAFQGTSRVSEFGFVETPVSDRIPAVWRRRNTSGGARVTDIGCVHGVSTIIMAQAYPDSTFVGYGALVNASIGGGFQQPCCMYSTN